MAKMQDLTHGTAWLMPRRVWNVVVAAARREGRPERVSRACLACPRQHGFEQQSRQPKHARAAHSCVHVVTPDYSPLNSTGCRGVAAIKQMIVEQFGFAIKAPFFMPTLIPYIASMR